MVIQASQFKGEHHSQNILAEYGRADYDIHALKYETSFYIKLLVVYEILIVLHCSLLIYKLKYLEQVNDRNLGVQKSRLDNIICERVLQQLLKVGHGQQLVHDFSFKVIRKLPQTFFNHIAAKLLHRELDEISFKLRCQTCMCWRTFQAYNILDQIISEK